MYFHVLFLLRFTGLVSRRFSLWTSVQDLELYANGFYGILPGAQGPGADDESDCYVNEKPKTWIFNLETIPNVNAVLFFGRPVFA